MKVFRSDSVVKTVEDNKPVPEEPALCDPVPQGPVEPQQVHIKPNRTQLYVTDWTSVVLVLSRSDSNTASLWWKQEQLTLTPSSPSQDSVRYQLGNAADGQSQTRTSLRLQSGSNMKVIRCRTN